MKPSIGRIVHYVSMGSQIPAAGSPLPVYPAVCRAAIVTEVGEDERGLIGLAVLNPTGIHFRELRSDTQSGVAQDEETKRSGTWHWPERVE